MVMGDITRIDTVQQYCDLFEVEALHPLVSVVNCYEVQPIRHSKKLYNIYAVLLKDTDCGTMNYGRSLYDYEKGSMLFIAPGQVMGSDDDGSLHQPAGWALMFHPELLRGTSLAHIIKEYSYFSYNANEALHLSEQERKVVIECINNVAEELRHPIDKHSRSLIIDTMKLLFDRCIRFYDRQFITRENANNDLLARFELLLNNYYHSALPTSKGIPTVQYCADQLCLSTNYFSDLVKRKPVCQQSSISSKNYGYSQRAHHEHAKSISQISDEMGFQYPQHFTRWFKKMEGCTPNEYRNEIIKQAIN